MSDRAQRAVLWILAISLVVGVALGLRYARGYRQLAGFGTVGPMMPENVGVELNKVRIIGRDKNKKAWVVRAGRINTTRTRTRFEFEDGISAQFLRDEKPRAVVTAPRAVYEAASKTFTVNGGVVCRVRDLTVRTPSVFWTVGENILRCPETGSAVLPGAGGGTLRGQNVTINITTRDIKAEKVSVKLQIEGDAADDVSTAALKRITDLAR
jgi:hypothetical protein